MSEPHPLTEDECASHQGTCPTPLELLRWQRDQARVEAERLSELGQEWQARARVAEAEVDRLTDALADAEETAANLNRRRWENFNAVIETQREVERLRGVVARVEAIHKPIRVYDECDHNPDHGCEPIEVYGYIGCSESVIGWACEVCCYDDEYPREDCPHGADHQGVAREQSCPTFVALGSADA